MAKKRKPTDPVKHYKATVEQVEALAHGRGKRVATGQTIVKMRLSEPPLARLKRLGRLNACELGAANEIVAGYHVAAGLPRPPDDPDLGRCLSLKPDAAERIILGQIDAQRNDIVEKYRTWRTDLEGHPALAAAISMLLDGRPARETERAEGWRNGSATGYLVTGLRHFAALRGNTPRGVRGWRLPERNRILEDAKQLARLVPRTAA